MEWSAPGYTEVKQLGAGASGRVALAVHDDTGLEVAIKYLSHNLLRDPAALARFQSEARLLTTLRDPHIATMWEYIQDAGGAAIVMELVNGVSLRALLRENGTTEPEAALVVLKGSLLGLAKAHALGLVHRDYKPENVIVRDDGVSKLVDFGIAVRQGSATRAEGTPPYMAPELWENGPASPATDVYAATAVFFECLTGHRPYRSTEPSVLGYQHLHAPVPFHDAPEPVRELVRRGLAKDPARRPGSALEFVAELESTARAAYGEDWEERGRRRLAALVALLALLLPRPQASTPEVTTSLARTVFRGMRSNARRLTMGGAIAAAAAVAVVVVLINRQPPVEEAAGAAAVVPPSEIATQPATGPPATPAETEPTPGLSAGPTTGPTTGPTPEPSGPEPEATPQVVPQGSPEAGEPERARPTRSARVPGPDDARPERPSSSAHRHRDDRAHRHTHPHSYAHPDSDPDSDPDPDGDRRARHLRAGRVARPDHGRLGRRRPQHALAPHQRRGPRHRHRRLDGRRRGRPDPARQAQRRAHLHPHADLVDGRAPVR
ncbi:protein kinase [Nonomuraea salmonea]|uniref:serine/threonine protein kinase n=1 Tax=Nonomuraea salmonea TaxID=46181 RepID=UPI003606CFB3